MSRVRTPILVSGRRVPALIAIAAALLLAFALTWQSPSATPDRSAPASQAGSAAGKSGKAGTDAVSLVDPAPGAGGGASATPSGTSVEVLGGPEVDVAERSAVDAASPAIASEASPVVDPVGGLGAPSIEAKIVRTASLELRVTKRGRFEDVWGDAQAVAAAQGGYVVASSRSGAGRGPRVASITMSIPTRRFDAAVSRLREVGGVSVRRLDVASQDVTQEVRRRPVSPSPRSRRRGTPAGTARTDGGRQRGPGGRVPPRHGPGADRAVDRAPRVPGEDDVDEHDRADHQRARCEGGSARA